MQVNITRRQLGMRVFGFDTPKPVQSFAQCGFDALTMAAIKKAGYACCSSDVHVSMLDVYWLFQPFW